MTRVDLRSAKNSLADLAYREILRAILAHELRPGDRLNPLELADHLGISPTPVKHSLARLAGEGIVEFRTGLGPFVVSPSDDDLAQYHDARLMCEVYAVQQGIGRVDGDFLAKLDEQRRRCDAALEDTGDPSTARLQFARADGGFHQQLVSLWPNAKTQAWYRQLNVHIRVAVFREITGDDLPLRRLTVATADHGDIYRALERGDATACTEVLGRHVRETQEALRARSRVAVAAHQD